jgi:hypothetical protein
MPRKSITDMIPHIDAPASALLPVPARAVPAPYTTAEGTQPNLSAREQADLAACEAALDNLRLAFAAAGKALQVIRDARLYRESYGTFDAYVEQRWGMGTSQAYRLIGEWPLAEHLSPIGDKVNEAQVRALLPYAEVHGEDAAAVVYQAVKENTQVTAAVLTGVVSVLPADRFDPVEAVAQIRAYLTGRNQQPTPPPPPDPGETFPGESGKFIRGLHRFARDANPGVVREVIASIRAALDEIEQNAPPADPQARSTP